MRLKYYSVTLRQMKIKKSFVFFIMIFLMFCMIMSLYYKKMRPAFQEICESNAHSIALKSTEEAIRKNIENITYQNIIQIEKNNEGKIIALTSNMNQMNLLSNRLMLDIEENLQKNETGKVNVPIGLLLGSERLGGYGIKIPIKTVLVGDTKIEYLSYFDSVGINQTRHRILVRVTSKVKVIAPFMTSLNEYSNEIVLAETILIGDIPSSYYQISGIEDLTTKNILDIKE